MLQYKTIPVMIIIVVEQLMPGTLNKIVAHIPRQVSGKAHQHHVINRSDGFSVNDITYGLFGNRSPARFLSI